LALLPIAFIRELNMPLMTKLGLAIIMGLGVCATIATGFKIYLFNDFFLHSSSTDPLYSIMDFVIVGEVEIYLAVIAASIPALRNLFIPVFSRLASKISGSSKGSEPCSPEASKITTTSDSLSTVEDSEKLRNASA
jgi:hypothetical protein